MTKQFKLSSGMYVTTDIRSFSKSYVLTYKENSIEAYANVLLSYRLVENNTCAIDVHITADTLSEEATFNNLAELEVIIADFKKTIKAINNIKLKTTVT